jgi:hypothetical protein
MKAIARIFAGLMRELSAPRNLAKGSVLSENGDMFCTYEESLLERKMINSNEG